MRRQLCHVFFDEYPKDSRIRRYTNALVENHYKIFVVSLNDGSHKFFEREESLYIYRLSLKKRRGSFLRRIWEYLVFQMFAFIMVSYIFFRHGVMIYHIHTLPDFLVFSSTIPKVFGAKIMLDFHELFPEFMMQHSPSLNHSSFLVKVLLFQERLSYKFADRVIVFHDPAKEILLNRVKENNNATTIMNGVDTSELPDFSRKKIDEFRIVYNGTINFNLNLSLAVEALSSIKNRDPSSYKNMSLYLYGDGPDLQNIMNTARKLGVENIHYAGRLKFTDMMKELEFASACILPPKKDIYSDLYYSLKLTEMIYYRIPVIATRLKTYLYYYPEDSLIYFESDNVEELADKILYLYDNREDLSQYTENAFKRYRKNSWEIMKERYLDLINSFN